MWQRILELLSHIGPRSESLALGCSFHLLRHCPLSEVAVCVCVCVCVFVVCVLSVCVCVCDLRAKFNARYTRALRRTGAARATGTACSSFNTRPEKRRGGADGANSVALHQMCLMYLISFTTGTVSNLLLLQVAHGREQVRHLLLDREDVRSGADASSRAHSLLCRSHQGIKVVCK
jgi:hypothetical protein